MTYLEWNDKYQAISDYHNKQELNGRKISCLIAFNAQLRELMRFKDNLQKSHKAQIAEINKRINMISGKMDELLAKTNLD